MTPYEELKAAILDYGDAAMENFLRCRALGRAVALALPEFLSSPSNHVSLVPSAGPFDPAKSYGDEAFSFNEKGVIRLEPISVGICLIVPNAEDSGSLWLRTGMKMEITGETFDIFVSHQPMVQIPLAFEGQLTPILKTVHREFLSVFRKDVMHFNDERYADGIGFMPR